MRRLAATTATLGLLVGLAVPAAVATTGTTPALRLVSEAPLVVRGSGFKPSDRVRLTARTREGTLPRIVTTNRAGVFSARWVATADYCTGIFIVRATDSTGRIVSLRVAPVARDCMPLAP